jgi:hypothetical protein
MTNSVSYVRPVDLIVQNLSLLLKANFLAMEYVNDKRLRLPGKDQ